MILKFKLFKKSNDYIIIVIYQGYRYALITLFGCYISGGLGFQLGGGVPMSRFGGGTLAEILKCSFLGAYFWVKNRFLGVYFSFFSKNL